MYTANQDGLKITFHNPNTTEELVKCLIKLIAKESAAGFINKSIYMQNEGDKSADIQKILE